LTASFFSAVFMALNTAATAGSSFHAKQTRSAPYTRGRKINLVLPTPTVLHWDNWDSWDKPLKPL